MGVSWSGHDRDCPRRSPQSDEFRCTCGADAYAHAQRENARLLVEAHNARLRASLEAPAGSGPTEDSK
jgi:hypothetical protein